MPTQLTSGRSPGDERGDRLVADVRGEQEELDRDQLLRRLLCLVGEDPVAGEAPDDHDAGEPLDRRVQAEPDERDRARGDAGGDRHGAFDGHQREGEPGQELDPTRELGVAVPADRGRCERQHRKVQVAHTAASCAATASTRSCAATGELVHHHPAVALGARQPRRLEQPQVMRDELLVAADDPAEVAYARARTRVQRQGDGQPGGIAERAGARRERLEARGRREPPSRRLRVREVEAQQVACVGIGHGADATTFARTCEHAFRALGGGLARAQAQGTGLFVPARPAPRSNRPVPSLTGETGADSGLGVVTPISDRRSSAVSARI